MGSIKKTLRFNIGPKPLTLKLDSRQIYFKSVLAHYFTYLWLFIQAVGSIYMFWPMNSPTCWGQGSAKHARCETENPSVLRTSDSSHASEPHGVPEFLHKHLAK